MVEIRKAELADAPDIARVHVAVWKTAYRGLMPEEVFPNLSVEQRTERWENTIPYEPVGTFVAIVDGELVGFVSAGTNRSDEGDRVAELYTIYILEQFAGQGIGKLLIEAIEQWMRDREYTDALLWVLANNVNARAFYERRGWIDDQFTKTEVVWGVEIPEARYRKRLV